jgi:hypothetical protein
MKRALVLLALGACSVPELSLEGKQCPCVDQGYVCDKDTNRCLPTNDGGMIIDSPAATQCLPAANETEVYRYAGTFDWQHADSTWMGGAAITQTSEQAMNSYAFKMSTELMPVTDYHIISAMRQTMAGSGSPSYGIVLRAQSSLQDKTKYTCTWIPKNRELRIESTDGGGTTMLGSTIVGGAAPPTSFTMEASIQGSTLACCIREIPMARIASAPDPAMTTATGFPGLFTNRMAASFGSFVVLKKN